MECEKCKDAGFIEYEAGLIVQFCDCEAGKQAEAKQRETLGYPETPPGPIMNEQFQSGVKDEPSISGAESDNQSTGSGDTSQPKRTRKSKKKKGTRKRANKILQ